MKIRFSYLSIVLIIIFSCLSPQLFSQNSKITGKVKDSQTNEPIIGANILLVGTSLGAATNINGEFAIYNIPFGDYKVRVSYIGYKTEEIDVKSINSQTFNTEILLNSDAIELGGEVVVSAQRQGQVSAINQQLTSERLVNIVSSEKMLEFPDANVAESISRLPGVSLQRDGGEGSSIVVRGLSPKYSKVTVDGVDMATTDAQERGTNLSGVSQENLKSIELYKSPTADMDGDAIGGTVNLQTGVASENPVAIFRSFGFYNGLENNFKQFSLFGKYSNRFFENDLGLQASVNFEDRDRSSDLFSGNYLFSPDPITGIPLKINNSSVTDRLENRKRIGGNFILDYNIGNGYIMLNSFLSSTSRDIKERRRNVDVDEAKDNIYMSDIERSLQSYVNTLKGEHTFGDFETDWSASFSYSRNQRPTDIEMQFQGIAVLPNANVVSKYQNALDYYNFVPIDSSLHLYRVFSNTEDVQERNIIGQLNFKYHINISTDINGYIKFGGKFKGTNRNQAFTEAQLFADLVDPWMSMRSSDYIDQEYTPNNFLNGRADLGLILDVNKIKPFYDNYSSSPRFAHSIFYAYKRSVSNDAGIPNYQAKENITSFYVMPRVNFGTLVTFIPSLRYEKVNNKYFGNNYIKKGENPVAATPQDYFVNDTTATVSYEDFLPMIHLKINPTNWFDIRLSYTRTLSRPDFNFLIPSQSLSQLSGVNVYKGNSQLKPARANSFDAYLSFYEPAFGLVSFGYFYKDISDVAALFTAQATPDLIQNGLPEFGIEPLNNNQYGLTPLYSGNRLRTPINLPESSVKGFELEIQTNLQLYPIPDFLKGIVISFNYSRILSKTFLPYTYSVTERLTVPPYFRTTYYSGIREGKIPGQADEIINLSLGYDLSGFSARISMFYQSKSLDNIGTREELDSYRSGFVRWDVSIKQSLFEFLTIYANVVNLNNKTDESFQATSGFGTSIEDYGRSGELGVQVRF
jgi:TonB-dependent receptor